jgi:hypothetical protein
MTERRDLGWIASLLCFVCLLPASSVWGADNVSLNRSSNQIVDVVTFCVPPNNNPMSFLYDRTSQSPFTVPQGFSFVITDIIITPCLHLPNTTDRFLVSVDIGVGSRNFLAGYIGASTQHYALAGGLVVPEGADLRARNLPDSADSVDVQLLGYIVNEPGLAVGAPFPFNPLL